MRHPLSTLLLLALILPAASAFADQTADDNRDFRPGRGGFRGNEHSERPGRFERGQLSYGGNGCPNGTMQVVFAPDNLSFTILFDKFTADTASNDKGQVGAMSCDALIPIKLPDGQQMEITRVDYRGFVSVPQGGRGMLHSMFNFVEQGRDGGRPGFGGGGGWRDRDRINIRYNFAGPVQENYEISTGTMNEGRGLQQTEVSPCGGDAQLRIHNDVRVMAPQGQQAQLTVDSIDGQSNAVYFVNWKSCQGRVLPPPPPLPPPPAPGCGRFGCQPPPPPPPGGMCGPRPCPPRFGGRR